MSENKYQIIPDEGDVFKLSDDKKIVLIKDKNGVLFKMNVDDTESFKANYKTILSKTQTDLLDGIKK